MSSHNVREAQMLRRLFPEAKVVHTVRDGRDAASSVTTKTWGPDDVIKGIDWWAERLRWIDRGVSGVEDGAEYGLPADRFHLVVLDDLVAGRRDECLDGLCRFLGVEPDDGMRAFFDGQMSARACTAGAGRRARAPSGGPGCASATSARWPGSTRRATTSRRLCSTRWSGWDDA